MATETTHGRREGPVLEEEFEHVPVPEDRRKSLVSVAAVWFGFPMILTNALFGGIYVAFLGFWTGVLAMLVGNVVLSIYVGMLSYRAGSTGRSFALQAQQTFGRYGYVVVSGFLATLVIGWFAFQTGLTGQTLQTSFGANAFLMTLIAGVLYIAVTFVGIRALAILGWVSAPLFVVLAALAIFLVTRENGLGGVFSYTPEPGVAGAAGALTFGAVVSVTIAGFVDSGTMTADFTRWSKNGRQGALAAFFAFPVANMISMLVGGVIVAAGASGDPTTAGGDFLPILADGGPVLAVVAVLFVFINLGSVCTHCLYNGAVGWSYITGGKMRLLTVVLGVIGVVAALAGIWSLFLNWLNLLGVLVPPLGAIIIMDQLVLRRETVDDTLVSWRPTAFFSWAFAAGVALLVNSQAPRLSVAVVGIAVAIATYTAATLLAGRRREPEAALSRDAT
ncbi:MAG: Cytosine/purine/uracil/thiamine/allantoin permease family protein [uncultured Rubrobacteraceae bacterium]|uniref:Cytosine/purine/uracil/thiamine/allantoin permease family protein n=1 Tax=uncultured Rubrobacteraceae bacterium TaxID=349277 RepID=A0A6J4QWL3_9ACTN|nr:MAG: Cytosine/purine/uracil/thiamine/allantoin permease family protein [uncultured Rubrobacteraceae bacterium]